MVICHMKVTIHKFKIFLKYLSYLNQELNFCKTRIRAHARHGGNHFMSKYFYCIIYNGEKCKLQDRLSKL